MPLSDYSLHKLERSEQIKSFECTDKDLNDFLLDDALNYHNELMGVTYLLVDDSAETIAAYYTLFNDKITRNDEDRRNWYKLSAFVPQAKLRKHYPAVKIGRLAVNTAYQHQNLGTEIIAFLKLLFTSDNRTGCRFITVDAYRAALDFYSDKCGFAYLTDQDKDDATRLMYYDLKRFKE